MPLRRSFSLVEVLIFVSILSVFLVTSAAVITVSMHQNSLQINKLKAIHYNDQLFEWLRGEKEKDWNSLVAKATSNTVYFCTDIPSWSETGACSPLLANLFKRYATLTIDNTQLNIVITTEWQEAGNTYSTTLQSVFSSWEE